ncbi:MAG TPA: nucleotidyl transferase AbiEii/AbiGii toxin family protein [Tepidiformaceae bacterium]|nr:nucleotidyl transferase AbiEii/AbiGii toxin family protein [Tepidiformaceae bacterium]HMO95677.1 nucleotidyl transferase AbiEii/AbiGii toxin family protein [Tepidiformaceae bacterium]
MDSSNPEQRLEEVAKALGALLRDADLDAALIGGHAVNFWDRPRFTEDFDFTVAADPPAIRRLVEALHAEGWTIVREQDGGGASGPDFLRLTNQVTGDFIDIQAAKTQYQDLVIQRAYRGPNAPFPVATPEDLIVLKLLAWRTVDQQDVLRLAAGEIDWDYVTHWCEVWQLSEKLGWLRRMIATESSLL